MIHQVKSWIRKTYSWHVKIILTGILMSFVTEIIYNIKQFSKKDTEI